MVAGKLAVKSISDDGALGDAEAGFIKLTVNVLSLKIPAADY